MSIRKGYMLLICSFLISLTAIAQYTDEEGGIESKMEYLRYVGLGAGATYQVMQDDAVSPLVYSKVSALPMLTHTKVSTTIYSQLQLKASLLNLTHSGSKDLPVNVKYERATIDYRFLVKMPVEMRNMDIRAGGLLSGMFGYKKAKFKADASNLYEYAASLGLCGRVTREFGMGGRTTFLSWDVGIPFLANFSRPSYLNRVESADPDNKPIQDFLGNSVTGTIGKYFRVNSRLSWMYRLSNGNLIQISYQWDYSKMKSINKVYYAEHILSLIFMFNY